MPPRGRGAASSKKAAAAPANKGKPAAAAARAAPAKNAQQPSPQRRSTRGKAPAEEEEEEEAGQEEDEEENEEGTEQQNGQMDEDEQQEDEADENKEADEEEDQQPTSSRRSSRHSTSAAAPNAKSAATQRGASAQERELLALVDAVGTWKGGSSSSTKEAAMGKTLKQAAALLADYRSTEKSVTPSTVDIPAADRPLLKTIAKAMVQRSVLQNNQDEVKRQPHPPHHPSIPANHSVVGIYGRLTALCCSPCPCCALVPPAGCLLHQRHSAHLCSAASVRRQGASGQRNQ